MKTGTTLEQQLLRAAERADFAAQQCTPQSVGVRWKRLREIREAEAREARQRAAWVREKLAGCTMSECCDCFTVRFLTGPIPSETAPGSPQGTGHSRAAHPKETP